MKHVSDRKEGKYDSIIASIDLAAYVIKLTNNEKYFPKRYRFSIVKTLHDKVIEITDDLVMANEIYPENKIELEERLLFQKKARASCRSLMTLMQVAAEVFNISSGSLEYFTSCAVKLRNHITAWIIADKERFKKL